MMPRLQVELQQTLRGPAKPSHAISCRAACKVPACMDQANWTARRAANRDPAVGIVARSARRVVPTAAAAEEPFGRLLWTGASSELAADRSPQRAPALGRSESGSGPPSVISTLQAQARSSKFGPAAPPTEWALQDTIAEGAFLDTHELSRVSGGNLNNSTKASKQSAIRVICVAKAIIEDALERPGLRTPAEDGWCCSQVSRRTA